MRLWLHILCLCICLTLINTSIANLAKKFLSYFVPQDGILRNQIDSPKKDDPRNTQKNPQRKGGFGISNGWVKNEISDKFLKSNLYSEKDEDVNENGQNKLGQRNIIDMRNFRADDTMSQGSKAGKIGREFYHKDQILENVLRRKGDDSKDESSLSSSSQELKDWKEEFEEMWLHKKFEALNQSIPMGDNVNMVAARPWGVPCGDPDQHDMPWGSCTLPAECDPEYRVYRGDMFCGRTRFVCCAILLTTYDMYQGFDVSFDSKSMTTDSEEKRDRERTSKERRKRRKNKDKKKRKKELEKRKKKMQRDIKKIVKEIRKILNKQYRNRTKEGKKKTKQLKEFIKSLKKQYRQDLKSVKGLHAKELLMIDTALMDRYNKMKFMNQDFVNNDTFREIVVNGTISKKGARMLLDVYPELADYLETRRQVQKQQPRQIRRRESKGRNARRDRNRAESHDYDIEYGYAYY